MNDSLMSESLKNMLGITEGGDPESQVAIGDVEGLPVEEPREPARFEIIEKETTVPDLEKSDAKIDYVVARNHTYTLLDMTTQALARALQVAQETEHPRAFESFNSLAQTARTLTQDLLGLQKVFKEVTKDRPEMVPPAQTNTQINGDVIVNNTPTQTTTSVIDMVKKAIESGEIKPMK